MKPPTHQSGLPPAIKRINCDGLLFIGDPQMSCVAPGRRLEADFLSVTLDKIRQCRLKAEERNLFMVFLGDMFQNPTQKKANTDKVVENTNRMLAGYANAMDHRPAVTMPGNHDMEEVTLTAGTTLATMRDLRVIDVIEPGGPYAIFEIEGKKVGLGGTPYGNEIPRDVRGVFGEPVDKVVWITHGLFQFDVVNKYIPEIFEIKGCDVVVNGHDHTTQKPKMAGQTQWFNPGNITRLSVDMIDHVPSSWEWSPSMPKMHMEQHVLQYNKIAFTLQGRQVEGDSKAATIASAKRAQSLFAQLISDEKNGSNGEMDRSASGDLIKEDIERILRESRFKDTKMKYSDGAAVAVNNLHTRALERVKI